MRCRGLLTAPNEIGVATVSGVGTLQGYDALGERAGQVREQPAPLPRLEDKMLNEDDNEIKSVLEGMPIVADTASTFLDWVGNASPSWAGTECLGVVSSCPRCGSPIYGPRSAVPGTAPLTLRTCGCYLFLPGAARKDIRDSMHTK